MLLSHLAELEALLIDQRRSLPAALATAAEAATLREAVHRHCLDPLFGGELLIEPGEVYDSLSLPGQPRPAFDLLLCQRHAPRLLREAAPTAFPAEAVVATLTVVPVLDEAALQQAVRCARSVKLLQRKGLRAAGAGPLRDDDAASAGTPVATAGGLPAIPCHLLAFDGPPRMLTVHGWLKQAYRDAGILEADLPPTGAERVHVASPALDGVFVLGRGFLNFDNMPWSFIDDLARLTAFAACWVVADAERGSLMSLYLQLQIAATAMAGTRVDPRPYSTGFAVPTLRVAN